MNELSAHLISQLMIDEVLANWCVRNRTNRAKQMLVTQDRLYLTPS